MTRGGKKRPSAGKSPTLGKSPRRAVNPESSEHLAPVWQVATVDTSGRWGWGSVKSASSLWEIHEKLSSFESMTWAQLGQSGSHAISAADLCADAQKRLVSLAQDDVDEVYSLRLAGKERIFGIRDGRILKILWWDPDHTCCPSHKKHT